MVLPPELQDHGVPAKWKKCVRLKKYVPGTKQAPRAWWLKVDRVLRENGFLRSRVDTCVYYKLWDGQVELIMAMHVDDMKGGGTQRALDWFEKVCKTLGPLKTFAKGKGESDFVGLKFIRTKEYTKVTQTDYVATLKEVPLSKERAKQKEALADEDEISAMRAGLGRGLWLTKSRADVCETMSRLAGHITTLQISSILKFNKWVRFVHQTKTRGTVLPVLDKNKPLRIEIVCDFGGKLESEDANRTGGVCILLREQDKVEDIRNPSKCAMVHWRSAKTRRVCASTFDGETLVAMEGIEMGLLVQEFICEMEYGPNVSLWQRLEARMEGLDLQRQALRKPLYLWTDAMDLVLRCHSVKNDSGTVSKRRREDIADLRELLHLKQLAECGHICGHYNMMDALTKELPHDAQTRLELYKAMDGYWAPIPKQPKEKTKLLKC